MEVLSVMGWVLYAVVMFTALIRLDQWVDKVKPNPPPKTELRLIDHNLFFNQPFTEKMDSFVLQESSGCPLGKCCPDTRPGFPFCPPGDHKECPFFRGVQK